MVAQSIKDADTFFGVELPVATDWTFGPEQAAAIHRPVLSVLGAETQPLWVEIAEFLRSSLPYVEDCTIDGVGHLLQIQRPEPVARAMAEFLWSETRWPATDGRSSHNTNAPIKNMRLRAADASQAQRKQSTYHQARGTQYAAHQRQAHRGRLQPDQKREIVERLTDAMVSIEGENMRPVTWVVVEEVASGDWGIGGKPLSTEDVKALPARTAA